MIKTNLSTFLICISFLFPLYTASATNAEQRMQQLLEKTEAPEGVVFEIVSSSASALEWAIPQARQYIQQLRTRFPELAIAIVTHGNEQFALQKNKSKQNKKVHSITKLLVEKEGVPVHVCGTYAGWRGIADEDFPDYVDVAAAGPAQINDYKALGYELIIIDD